MGKAKHPCRRPGCPRAHLPGSLYCAPCQDPSTWTYCADCGKAVTPRATRCGDCQRKKPGATARRTPSKPTCDDPDVIAILENTVVPWSDLTEEQRALATEAVHYLLRENRISRKTARRIWPEVKFRNNSG